MARTYARRAFPFIAALFSACVVIQVFLAGLGVFDDARSFLTHRDFGYTFGWLTLLMLVAAILGQMGRRFVGLSGLLLVLFALQSVFVALRADMPQVAALHPVIGFAIMLVALVATWTSWPRRPEVSANA